MRLLFISNTFPRDIQRSTHGVFKRIRTFLDAFKEIADIDVLFYVIPNVDISSANIARLEQAFFDYWGIKINLFLCHRAYPQKKASFFASRLDFLPNAFCSHTTGPEQLEAFHTCLDRAPDVVFAHRLETMAPILGTQRPLPAVFLDLDDIEHVAFMRSIKQPPLWRSKFLYYLTVPSVLLLERRATKLARSTFVCSELDRRYLSRVWRLPGVTVVPNSVKIPELMELPASPTMLFLGSFSYAPNAIAADFLITKIWPLIKRAIPEALLLIAGNQPEHINSFNKGAPGVEFTGFVDDLDELYRKTRVVCCPILSGGGTRVKIIEAAGYGKPVVSTRIGAEGIELQPDHEILLRDDRNAFAQACIELLRDLSACKKIGVAARERVCDLYDRNKVMSLIKQQIQQAV